MAEAQAEAPGIRLEAVLVQARDVGAALVDEAVERDADLLVSASPTASGSAATSRSAGPFPTS